jgi:hypothetical protein
LVFTIIVPAGEKPEYRSYLLNVQEIADNKSGAKYFQEIQNKSSSGF